MKKQSKTAQIRKMLAQGKPAAEIAKKADCTKSLVYYVQRKMEREEATKKEPVDIYTTDPVNTPLAYSAGMRGKYAVPEPVQEVVQVSPDDSANHPAHYDPVNHPPHYKEGGIEVIDFIEAKQLGYHLGNVVKYISRAYHKGGMEDLLKAQWYLNRAIEKGEV